MHSSLTGTQTDPPAMAAFAASLAHLPPDEIERAKVLYIKNALTDYRTGRTTAIGVLIVLALVSLFFPWFCIGLIPMTIIIAINLRNARQKITNAIQIWNIDCAKWEIGI
jgi:hypothetical protein